MKTRLRTFLVWMLLILLFVVGYMAFQDREAETLPVVPFGAFKLDAEAGSVREVHVEEGGRLDVTLHDGRRYLTAGDLDPEIHQALRAHRTAIQWESGGRSGRSFSLTTLLVILAVAVLVLLLLRKWRGSTMLQVASFVKSKARPLEDSRVSTFADVGGCSEAKELLLDLVDYLQNPRRWQEAGARVPRGILLEGPPGCGKTLLARALAGEAKAKFFFVSASEFVELFVGVGAARVRDTFEMAAKEAPAVLFIDELDAVARHRGSGIGGSHDEREQTLNQLLVCLDGLQRYERVVVLAASNRSDILDAALLRPGRFDRRVHVGRPSRADRLEILRIHARNKPLAPDASLESLADMTGGLNGAELEGLTNEAAILALRRARSGAGGGLTLRMDDFKQALAQHLKKGGAFNSLDALLIGSTSQVYQPAGLARARLILADGGVVCGELLWANAEFVKVRPEGGSGEVVLPKSQVKSLEALDGTTPASPEEARGDPWAARPPGVA